MKHLIITTRKTDKLRAEIKKLDWFIDRDPNNMFDVEWKKTKRIATIATLFGLDTDKFHEINVALDRVNGTATAFTIHSYADVHSVARRAEELLEARGVTMKNRIGTTVVYCPAGASAKSYKYTAITTVITLRRVADGWRLTDITRGSVYPKSPEVFLMTVSVAAAGDIERAAFAGIVVAEAKAVAA